MFNWFKRLFVGSCEKMYDVTYIIPCTVSETKFVFERKYMEHYYVRANDMVEAARKFALNNALFPHVCIVRVCIADKMEI